MKKPGKIKVKPFLKWAGGKGQLLEQFKRFYPSELKSGAIKYYYEPFTGGGAVYFDLIQNFRFQESTLFDINEELVLCWKVVQRDVIKLIEYLHEFQQKYTSLDAEAQKVFYYDTRKEFNLNRQSTDYSKYSEDWVFRAAQTIFMNKTCFNGLFRFNQKGEFNVPVGRYKNPKILDESNLLKVSEVIAGTIIKRADYGSIEEEIQKDSFVYFDPPYRPISNTSNFTNYNKNTFNDNEQRELAQLFRRLDKKQIKVMLSNSDPKNVNPNDNFFDDLYADFYITRIPANRAINSDATKRNAINEIIVTNYPLI